MNTNDLTQLEWIAATIADKAAAAEAEIHATVSEAIRDIANEHMSDDYDYYDQRHEAIANLVSPYYLRQATHIAVLMLSKRVDTSMLDSSATGENPSDMSRVLYEMYEQFWADIEHGVLSEIKEALSDEIDDLESEIERIEELHEEIDAWSEEIEEIRDNLVGRDSGLTQSEQEAIDHLQDSILQAQHEIAEIGCELTRRANLSALESRYVRLCEIV